MPSLWEALKNKLDERLNWDTFKNEVSQGFETMPETGMVISPTTIGKFNAQYAKNFFQLAQEKLGLPDEVLNAIAFIKTKNPSLWAKIKGVKMVESLPGDSVAALSPEDIIELSKSGNIAEGILASKIPAEYHFGSKMSVPDFVNSLGHEIGHKITSTRNPEAVRTADKLRIMIEDLSTRGIKTNRLEEMLASTADEVLASKAGNTALSAFNKYKDLLQNRY